MCLKCLFASLPRSLSERFKICKSQCYSILNAARLAPVKKQDCRCNSEIRECCDLLIPSAIAKNPSSQILFLLCTQSELLRSTHVSDGWSSKRLNNCSWFFLPSILVFFSFRATNLSLFLIPSTKSSSAGPKQFIDKSTLVTGYDWMILARILAENFLKPWSLKINLWGC